MLLMLDYAMRAACAARCCRQRCWQDAAAAMIRFHCLFSPDADTPLLMLTRLR